MNQQIEEKSVEMAWVLASPAAGRLYRDQQSGAVLMFRTSEAAAAFQREAPYLRRAQVEPRAVAWP